MAVTLEPAWCGTIALATRRGARPSMRFDQPILTTTIPVLTVHAMANLNVTMPKPMQDSVKARVQQGDYTSAAEYVRELIRRDLARQDLVRELDPSVSKPAARG